MGKGEQGSLGTQHKFCSSEETSSKRISVVDALKNQFWIQMVELIFV